MRFGSLDELLVQVKGADWIRQFAEVHLEQGGHGVNVTQYGAVVVQVGNTVLIESDPR